MGTRYPTADVVIQKEYSLLRYLRCIMAILDRGLLKNIYSKSYMEVMELSQKLLHVFKSLTSISFQGQKISDSGCY